MTKNLTKFKISAIVILLLQIILYNVSYAQCVNGRNYYIYPNHSSVGCSAESSTTTIGYKISLKDYNFNPPYSFIEAFQNSMPISPTVTFDEEFMYINDLTAMFSGAVTSHNYLIKFSDSCGLVDTISFNLYESNLRNIYSRTQNHIKYNHCEETLKAFIPIEIQSGIDSHSLLIASGGFLTVSSYPYEIIGDTIIISNFRLNSTVLYSSYDFRLHIIDSCGTVLNYNFYGTARTYNTSFYPNHVELTCGEFGYQNIFLPIELEGPFFIYLIEKDDYYNSQLPDITPSLRYEGDSTFIDNILPGIDYSIFGLDNCGDTFNYQISIDYPDAYDTTIKFKALPFTCDTTLSLYFIEPSGYDIVDASFAALISNDDYSLSLEKYGDSVVIHGFPKSNSIFVLSLRDSICHTNRFAAFQGFYDFSTPNFDNLQNFYYTCEETEPLTFFTRVMGAGPLNAEIINAAAGTSVSFNADTLLITNVTLPRNFNHYTDTFLHIKVTDNCGNIDTFLFEPYSYYNNIDFYKRSELGGCDGMNNALVKYDLSQWIYADSSNEYINVTIDSFSIEGPGTPDFIITSTGFEIHNMNPDSEYKITIKAACNPKLIFKYRSLPSNSDAYLSPTTFVEGLCIESSEVEGNISLQVKAQGINYPYTAYLSGVTEDTIENITSDTFKFKNLNSGSYTITTLDVCNNIASQSYYVSPPAVSNSSWIYHEWVGCDSVKLLIHSYLYGNVGPEYYRLSPTSVFLTDGVDTYSYTFETIDTIKGTANRIDTAIVKLPTFGFTGMNIYRYIVTGCGDTVNASSFYHYLSLNRTSLCEGGENFYRYSFNIINNPNEIYPLTFTFISGTYEDSSSIVVNREDGLITWDIGVGEDALYHVFDSCGRYMFNVHHTGPDPLNYYTNTRLCNTTTDGRHKGDVIISVSNATAGTNLKYTFISGPSTIFTDTIINNTYLRLRNIDTGTYSFQIEEMNACNRSITATVRVQPFIDSVAYTITPGCLNANVLNVQYYTNTYTTDYNLLSPSTASLTIYTDSWSFSGYAFNDIYNVPSNTVLNINLNSCRTFNLTTAPYQGPQIKASAGFNCSDGFSIAIGGLRGVTPYTYEILSGNPVDYSAPEQSSNIFTGLPAASGNTYQVRLKDQCGNAFTTLVNTDSMNIPLIESGFACVGSDYVASADSIPNVSYKWVKPDGSNINSRTFSLNPVTHDDTGTYILEITNNITGCVQTVAHQVEVVDCELGVELFADTILCNGESTATVYASAFGGVAPYTLEWNDGSINDTLFNVPAGTYYVTVIDAVGTLSSDTIEVVQLEAIDIEFTKVDNLCHGESSGSISTTITGGTPPYILSWSNDSASTSISNLIAGDYTLTVEDQNGCVANITITIDQPEELSVSLEKTNLTCNGINDGTVAALPLGGTAPYTYLWNTGDTDSLITDLAPGNYHVTITDANGCSTISTSINVTQPSAVLAWFDEVLVPTCITGENGSIKVNVLGGTSPYAFSWNSGESTKDLSNLPSGDFELTITDNNGCETIIDTTLVPSNCVPLATNDSFTTDKNTPLLGATVAENDTMSGDGNNVWSLIDGSGSTPNGNVTLNSNGSFNYTPNTGFVGIDSFEYQLCDANDDCVSAMAYIIVQSPLNVQLNDFYGIENNCDVHLFWEINESTTIVNFEIERSNDGRVFEHVANESSKENILNYSFIDKIKQQGEHFYRIKLVDLDGSFTYSKSLPIYVECTADRIIKVYPTISNNLVFVEGANQGEVIKVYDASGRLMLEQKSNSMKETINIQNLAAGMYHLFIYNENEQVIQFKIIKE